MEVGLCIFFISAPVILPAGKNPTTHYEGDGASEPVWEFGIKNTCPWWDKNPGPSSL